MAFQKEHGYIFSKIPRIKSDKEENKPKTEERKKTRLDFLRGENTIFRKIFQKYRRIISKISEHFAKKRENRTEKEKILREPFKIQEHSAEDV